MSVPNEGDKRGLNNVARKFIADDDSEHYYIAFGNIWIFIGDGAVGESSKAIAGTIPGGSLHINRDDGTISVYTGSAWKTVTTS